jgi:hypothetical protein
MDTARTAVRPGALLLALLALLAGVLLPVGPAQAAVDGSAESEFVSLVNRERTSRGLAALTVRTDLRDVARSHSRRMASSGNLHHNPNLTTQVTNWVRLAENVGTGSGAASLHSAFMSSSGHRANILDTKVSEVGIGVELAGGRLWVTQVFRAPERATESTTSTTTSPTTTTTRVTPVRGTPLWGDWNGDGTSTPGWFSNGVFYLSGTRKGGGEITVLRYGQRGDRPVVGDWNGDGRDTIGVVRGNLWILRNEYRRDAKDIVMRYGEPGDVPVVGDWDGNGTDTLGVVRGNLWILRNEYRRSAKDIVMRYGLPGDVPVAGDWNGNGTDTLGVVRGNLWILRNEYRRGAKDIVMTYGRSSDHKVVGDYDGDGVDTLGIVRSDLWVLRSEYRRSATDLVFRF